MHDQEMLMGKRANNVSDDVQEMDNLTGLLGRDGFFGRMRERLVEDPGIGSLDQHTVIYFNILNFKLYNMTFGLEAGDQFLRFFADLLQQEFPGDLLARFSDDHFVVCSSRKDLEEALTLLYNRCMEQDLCVHAGLRPVGADTKEDMLTLVCDQAKIACDSLKTGAAYFDYYREELKQELERNLYVIENLDHAIAKGYIQIYYQPVVRSLNGKISSMEALTRWVDPDRGLLTPAMFIPVLEEANLIHKLDRYVIREVGRMLRDSIEKELPIIPVSFNLSRADFVVGNSFDELEHTVQKYGLQREYLCVEITESILMSDKTLVMNALQKFHEAGYSVWMDDFGSGYSSLNLLKEFPFDELKIDMLFLKNLDEKGRQIVRTIVDMAKKLGIHTLAEGAETAEHVDFLRDIGCEKIQGFYYGRPQPIDLMRKHVQDFGLDFETRAEAHLYEKAGAVNVITEVPVAIFTNKGEQLQMIYANAAYQQVLDTLGGRNENELNKIIDQPDYALYRRFQEFTRAVIECREERTLYYVDNGQKLRLQARTIAGVGDKYLIKARLDNITFEDEKEKPLQFDGIIRNLMMVFSGFYQICPEEDSFLVLEDAAQIERVARTFYGVRRILEKFLEENVYIDDRERCREYFGQFLESDFFEKNKRATFCDWFRVRQTDGSYKWMEYMILVMKDSRYRLLVCAKEAAIEYADDPKATLQRMVSDTLNQNESIFDIDQDEPLRIWEGLLKRSPVLFFTTDKYGLVKTVSHAFLDFLGLHAPEEAIGKNWDELGFHVSSDQLQKDVISVLQRGRTITNHPHACIVNGVSRHVLVNLYPVYQEGRVDGLFGYLYDNDQIASMQKDMERSYCTDEVTGLLNLYGVTLPGNEMYRSYHAAGHDFQAVMIEIPELKELYVKYGADKIDEILPRLIMQIRQVCSPNIVQARISLSRFLFLVRTEKEDEGALFIQRLCDTINQIHSLQGYPCTFFAQGVCAFAEEAESFDRLLFLLQTRLSNELDRVTKANTEKNVLTFELEKFDERDDRIYIADPETYELIYMNYAWRRDLNLEKSFDCKAKKCYEIIYGETKPCETCANNILKRKSFYTSNYHHPLTGKDYSFCDTLVPYGDRMVRYSTAYCVSDLSQAVMKKEQLVYTELTANDAISIALRESDPNVGIRKLLERITIDMKASKTFLFEENRQNQMTNTYVWDVNYGSGRMARMPQPPQEVSNTMQEIFAVSNEFKVEKIELIRQDLPFLYKYFKEIGCKSLIALPIRREGGVIGFVGTIDPSPESMRAAGLFLGTLMRFLSILLRNRDIMQQLDSVSKRDDLTGVMNRRAYNELQNNHKLEHPTAVIYADVNGLKEINDTKGHKAGDALIRSAANVMSSMAGSEYVFRMGGDEFLIISQVQDRMDAYLFCDKLQKAFVKEGVSVAIGMRYGRGKGEEINPLVVEADRRMYIVKEKMHQQMKEQQKEK